MIIFDASPLIHLTQIGKIEFIFKLVDYIFIPPSVYKEVIEKGLEKGYSDAVFLQEQVNLKKIQIKIPSTHDNVLHRYLHEGEAEVIELGKEIDVIMVIDEKKARMVAEQTNLLFFTTLDILLSLKKENIISFDLFHSNIMRYAHQGWISPIVIKEYLQRGKEYE